MSYQDGSSIAPRWPKSRGGLKPACSLAPRKCQNREASKARRQRAQARSTWSTRRVWQGGLQPAIFWRRWPISREVSAFGLQPRPLWARGPDIANGGRAHEIGHCPAPRTGPVPSSRRSHQWPPLIHAAGRASDPRAPLAEWAPRKPESRSPSGAPSNPQRCPGPWSSLPKSPTI